MYKNWRIKKSEMFKEFELPEEDKYRIVALRKQAKQEEPEKARELDIQIQQIMEDALENFNKAKEALQEKYAKICDWCNENQQYYISDEGDYFSVQPIPEMSVEEKSEQVRNIRDAYLAQYVDVIVSNPLRWADMTEEQQEAVKAYRKYLLDIPQSENFPDISALTFEEWSNINE